jgi:hypothetical protein
MSVAVNSPSPFLPITSLQLQHLQAVTHSFAQRRPAIPPVFNNFRTLSVATGVVPLWPDFSGGPNPPFLLSVFSSGYKRCPPSACTAYVVVLRCRRRGDVITPKLWPGKNNLNGKSSISLSPFNAVYRHSMHGNTVRRKVWSHTANSGRLDVETFGGSAHLFHCWLHLRPAGRHNLTSNN